MNDRKPRRSQAIVTTLLAAAATAAMAMLDGCSHDTSTTARCVDQDGHVLPDSACRGGTGGGVYYGGGYGAGRLNSVRQPRWVYGGSGGTSVGSRAVGFSTSPPADGEIATRSGTVIRGGFGGEGAAHSGFGGDGGGHGGGGGE